MLFLSPYVIAAVCLRLLPIRYAATLLLSLLRLRRRLKLLLCHAMICRVLHDTLSALPLFYVATAAVSALHCCFHINMRDAMPLPLRFRFAAADADYLPFTHDYALVSLRFFFLRYSMMPLRYAAAISRCRHLPFCYAAHFILCRYCFATRHYYGM